MNKLPDDPSLISNVFRSTTPNHAGAAETPECRTTVESAANARVKTPHFKHGDDDVEIVLGEADSERAMLRMQDEEEMRVGLYGDFIEYMIGPIVSVVELDSKPKDSVELNRKLKAAKWIDDNMDSGRGYPPSIRNLVRERICGEYGLHFTPIPVGKILHPNIDLYHSRLPRTKTNYLHARFGKLVVVGVIGHNKHRHLVLSCRCDCNRLRSVTLNALRQHKITQCESCSSTRSVVHKLASTSKTSIHAIIDSTMRLNLIDGTVQGGPPTESAINQPPDDST